MQYWWLVVIIKYLFWIIIYKCQQGVTIEIYIYLDRPRQLLSAVCDKTEGTDALNVCGDQNVTKERHFLALYYIDFIHSDY